MHEIHPLRTHQIPQSPILRPRTHKLGIIKHKRNFREVRDAFVGRTQGAGVVGIGGVGVVEPGAGVEAVDVGVVHVFGVLSCVKEAGCVVEDVAGDGGYAFELPAFVGEAFGAGVEGDADGWVVGVELHDFGDGGVGEVPACRVLVSFEGLWVCCSPVCVPMYHLTSSSVLITPSEGALSVPSSEFVPYK